MRVVNGVHIVALLPYNIWRCSRHCISFICARVCVRVCFFYSSVQLLLNSTHSFVLLFLGADEWKSFQLRFETKTLSTLYGPALIRYAHVMVVVSWEKTGLESTFFFNFHQQQQHPSLLWLTQMYTYTFSE